jgi:hypothetical protein
MTEFINTILYNHFYSQSITITHNESTAQDSLHSRYPVSILFQLLNSATELTARSHVSSLYNFGKDRIEIHHLQTVPLLLCAYSLLRKRV